MSFFVEVLYLHETIYLSTGDLSVCMYDFCMSTAICNNYAGKYDGNICSNTLYDLSNGCS